MLPSIAGVGWCLTCKRSQTYVRVAIGAAATQLLKGSRGFRTWNLNCHTLQAALVNKPQERSLRWRLVLGTRVCCHGCERGMIQNRLPPHTRMSPCFRRRPWFQAQIQCRQQGKGTGSQAGPHQGEGDGVGSLIPQPPGTSVRLLSRFYLEHRGSCLALRGWSDLNASGCEKGAFSGSPRTMPRRSLQRPPGQHHSGVLETRLIHCCARVWKSSSPRLARQRQASRFLA